MDHASNDDNYAFFVHSQESLSQQWPPDIDNHRLARQRRRRTSPDDHAVLEAEYLLNPKPDRSARQALVRRVALGEKEIQIWFQNRRQMTRRKSRPSLGIQVVDFAQCPTKTEELSDYACAYSPNAYNQLTPPLSQLESASSLPSSSEASSRTDHLPPTPSEDRSPNNNNDSNGATCQIFKVDEAGIMRPRQPADPFRLTRAPSLPNRSNVLPDIVNQPLSAKHSVASERASPKEGQEGSDTKNLETLPARPSPLRRTNSLIKFSLDDDGKAQVTARTGFTPSPPARNSRDNMASESSLYHNHQRKSLPPYLQHPSGLQRSLSAFEPRSLSSLSQCKSSLESSSASKASPIPPLTGASLGKYAGRSRDARTWEFYCDSDARNALNHQAEQEARGSAVAAIGLIRSRSQSNCHNNHSNRGERILTPNAQKRNVQLASGVNHVAGIVDATKRMKKSAHAYKDSPAFGPTTKPKLGRAASSLARLQSNNSPRSEPKSQLMTRPTSTLAPCRGQREMEKKLVVSACKSNLSTIYLDPDDDSDKENRVPDEHFDGDEGFEHSSRQAGRAVRHESALHVRHHGGPASTHSSHAQIRTGLISASSYSSSGAAYDGLEKRSMNRYTNPSDSSEDLDDDEEVIAFMQGQDNSGVVVKPKLGASEAARRLGPRPRISCEKEDLDCVENLLRLSQSVWR